MLPSFVGGYDAFELSIGKLAFNCCGLCVMFEIMSYDKKGPCRHTQEGSNPIPNSETYFEKIASVPRQ